MEMSISKREATKRHLNFAIRHYFEGGDIVPISAVAGAAHIIAHDLVEHIKPNNSWANVGAEASGIKMNEALSAIRKLPNWLKHAKSDPESLMEIEAKDLEFILFHTMLDIGELNQLDEAHSIEVSVFQLWFVAKHNKFFTATEYREVVSEAQEHFPGLDAMSHEEQLKVGFTVLMTMVQNA